MGTPCTLHRRSTEHQYGAPSSSSPIQPPKTGGARSSDGYQPFRPALCLARTHHQLHDRSTRQRPASIFPIGSSSPSHPPRANLRVLHPARRPTPSSTPDPATKNPSHQIDVVTQSGTAQQLHHLPLAPPPTAPFSRSG
ncbi:hypothetical protein ACLOJK_006213 [Asimina triloba]